LIQKYSQTIPNTLATREILPLKMDA